MANPHASPRARARSVESLETISVHYSPAEDPYWTELIAHYAYGQDSEINEQNRVDDNEDEDKKKDAKLEFLPFLLDDIFQGQGQEVEGERWPSLCSPDPVTVHHEAEALVKEFRELSARREPGISSVGIDVRILQKYRQGRGGADADTEGLTGADENGENEYEFELEHRAERDRKEPKSRKSARAQLLRESEAITRLIRHQNRRHSSDDTYPPPHPDARLTLWQTTLLRNLPPSPPPLPPPPPPVLSDPLLTNLWVRKEMQGRWTHKYHASLAAERAKLAADEAEQKAVASAKRKLHRTVVADCMREALGEIDAALRTRLREPLADIDAVAAEWKGLQCLALRDHFTLSEACAILEEREQVLAATVQDVMPDLEDRLGAVEQLLAVAAEEMRKMRTRYARLCAWDVWDAGDGSGEREAEMKRRLGRPEALVYLLKGWEDVRMVREMAWAVVERFEDMECGLGDLTRVGMEYGTAAEGAWLLGEVETLDG